MIVLSIAWCAIHDGHIAIDFLIDKLNLKVQKFIYVITGSAIVIFMVFFTVRIIIYGTAVVDSCTVSPTADVSGVGMYN